MQATNPTTSFVVIKQFHHKRIWNNRLPKEAGYSYTTHNIFFFSPNKQKTTKKLVKTDTNVTFNPRKAPKSDTNNTANNQRNVQVKQLNKTFFYLLTAPPQQYVRIPPQSYSKHLQQREKDVKKEKYGNEKTRYSQNHKKSKHSRKSHTFTNLHNRKTKQATHKKNSHTKQLQTSVPMKNEQLHST